jgi:MFS family permease
VIAALALTASTLTWTAGSWVQARCIARYGPRRLVRPGECLVVIGLGIMCLVLLPSVPPALAIVAWAVAGLGIGTAYSPLSVTTLDRAAPGEEGRATSALQLCDVLGQAMGTRSWPPAPGSGTAPESRWHSRSPSRLPLPRSSSERAYPVSSPPARRRVA